MIERIPVRFRFGLFEADLEYRQLLRDGQTIPLQGKPFAMLHTLLMRRGEVVTRNELAQRLWPGIHVQVNQGLNAATRKLRIALQDDAENPRYIETIGSYGYRFVHPVEITRVLEVPRNPGSYAAN